MDPRYRRLAPLALILIGGLVLVGALALVILAPPGAIPTPTYPPVVAPDDGIPRVSVDDAKVAYDLDQAVFLDVRADVYYQQSHIPGALSIPLDELETRLDELDPEDWIITYCT